MNKNLKAALIVGGVALALVAVAFVATAAGLTSYARMPYTQQMMQGAEAWQGGMMGRGMGGNMMSMMGSQATHMMDPNNMPHHNWASEDSQAPWENCPYFDQAQ